MSNIQMGNDEFILYTRKKSSPSTKSTDDLGLRIWTEIQRLDPNARKVHHLQSCIWKNCRSIVSASSLPKTASQFSFNRDVLPRLYDFLDNL